MESVQPTTDHKNPGLNEQRRLVSEAGHWKSFTFRIDLCHYLQTVKALVLTGLQTSEICFTSSHSQVEGTASVPRDTFRKFGLMVK